MQDPITHPDPLDDTNPSTDLQNELVEAIEWLRRAGVVTGERPAFVGFFEEVMHSGEHKPAPSAASTAAATPAPIEGLGTDPSTPRALHAAQNLGPNRGRRE